MSHRLRKRYGRSAGGDGMFMARFVHKISPSDKDVKGPVHIRGGAFSNRNTLSKAFRDAGLLLPGGRLSSFRVEGEKVVAFPMKSIWHAIILTPA